MRFRLYRVLLITEGYCYLGNLIFIKHETHFLDSPFLFLLPTPKSSVFLGLKGLTISTASQRLLLSLHQTPFTAFIDAYHNMDSPEVYLL